MRGRKYDGDKRLNDLILELKNSKTGKRDYFYTRILLIHVQLAITAGIEKELLQHIHEFSKQYTINLNKS